MAATGTDNPTPFTRRQHALADIQFASVVDDDLTQSEDETPEERDLELESVQSAIGISIGRQQTRLTSPKTPAAEKAAALDETDGGILFDGFEDRIETAPESPPTRRIPSDPETAHVNTVSPRQAPPVDALPPARLPSPWRAGPKTFVKEKPSDHRAVLRQNLQPGNRPRASSGGSMGDTMRKYMTFSLPSLPKTYKDLHFSLPSFSALSLDGQAAPDTSDRRRRGTCTSSPSLGGISQRDGAQNSMPRRSEHPSQSTLSPHAQSNTAPIAQREFSTGSESTIGTPTLRPSSDRPTPRLRRSNSEGSLLVYRTKSFASSLGDDSRFESVQEQVNSRLKAIRDSWQDANFKFPSPTLPNFNFNYRDDLFRNRNGSVPPKIREQNHGTTLRARDPGSAAANNPRTKAKRPGPAKTAESETHPFFAHALQELEGDLVVLGGYRGSVLRSAEPPHRQLWVPIKAGLNLRKVDLEVPFEADADEHMEETIISSGMLKHIGPVDISKRLFKRLRACDNAKTGKVRIHDYGYDWRLSPHFLARRMTEMLESLPCNQPNVPREKRGAIIVAHSLGGLITRHVINKRPDLVAGVVYAGVPQRCINILGPFRNGDDVLFSSRVLTAQVNFSIRTSFALLPLDGKCFINKYTKEEYPIDFFDPKTWTDYRLSPCMGPALPRPDAPKDSTLSVSGLFTAMTQALPTFPSRKFSISRGSTTNTSGNSSSASDTTRGAVDVARNAADKVAEGGAETAGMGPQMSQGQATSTQSTSELNPATAVSIPYPKAVEYLTRTLAEIKQFKQELDHIPELTASNAYPPIALIYGKTTPTVYGAKVESREAIPRADCYDELAFASGDGVVLARAAMVPDGYSVVRGGVVSSDRGHITLLGDLEAVGRCLHAVIQARKSGVGMGEKAQKIGDGLGIETRPLAA
ncbi:hypothetical protein CC86DRAFT_369215 [Ophiobolus disseminans]|uniref:Alpha/beta-hydrolase n=1 Tax=Ophiobolus disseminans TaxID=1469910 RepID=A0A6A7A5W5_9PLEO|nr:hypothetical protein CC86DRAFT_369215 [Ophiobolus disseminans]